MEGRKEATKTTTTTTSSGFFDPTPYLGSCHHCGRSNFKITPTISSSISAPFTFPAPPAAAASGHFFFTGSDNVSSPITPSISAPFTFPSPPSTAASSPFLFKGSHNVSSPITPSISSPVTFPAPPATAATTPLFCPRSDNVSLPTAAAAVATTPCCVLPAMAESQAVKGAASLPIAIPPATPKRKLFCDKATDGQMVATRLSPSLHSQVEPTEKQSVLRKRVRTLVYELNKAMDEYEIFLNRKEEEGRHSHQINGQPAAPSDGGNLF